MAARTVNPVAPGSVPGLVSVRVELRNVCPGVNETGFGENAAVTPEGSPDAVRAAVNAPELPPSAAAAHRDRVRRRPARRGAHRAGLIADEDRPHFRRIREERRRDETGGETRRDEVEARAEVLVLDHVVGVPEGARGVRGGGEDVRFVQRRVLIQPERHDLARPPPGSGDDDRFAGIVVGIIGDHRLGSGRSGEEDRQQRSGGPRRNTAIDWMGHGGTRHRTNHAPARTPAKSFTGFVSARRRGARPAPSRGRSLSGLGGFPPGPASSLAGSVPAGGTRSGSDLQTKYE